MKAWLESNVNKEDMERHDRWLCNELNELFGNREVFKNPKPSALIEQLLSYVSTPYSMIVDSFAGSGTTAQAVVALNRACRAPRIRRYATGEAGVSPTATSATR